MPSQWVDVCVIRTVCVDECVCSFIYNMAGLVEKNSVFIFHIYRAAKIDTAQKLII